MVDTRIDQARKQFLCWIHLLC